MPKAEDLSNQIFNNWKVNYKLPNRKYNCTCLLCNKEFEVLASGLKSGKSKSCIECSNKLKQNTSDDLSGQTIHDWTLIKYIGNGEYTCKCKCGNTENKKIYYIKNGISQRCTECSSKLKSEAIREKLEGIQFGDLIPIKYLGNSKYLCKCTCGNEHITTSFCLKNKISTRCLDCSAKLRRNKYRSTMLERYGDIASCKIVNPREYWQLTLLNNKEELLKYINEIKLELGRLPTSVELAKDLDVSVHILLTYTRDYNINLYREKVSTYELEIRSIIEEYNYAVRYNDKTVIYPYELDIYIPELKLAIEFNGDYWHSSLFKEEEYHQMKTLSCIEKGIRLIHIFEYEWKDRDTKEKIVNMLRSILNTNKEMIYARKCEVSEISLEDTKEFINKYHLQGYTNSSVKIGIKYKNEIIGVMTLGKPRFSKKYQYEILRLVYKDSIGVIGGTEKLLKYFIDKYNPDNILTYSDLSRFTGKTYLKAGFKPLDKAITQPNYIWINLVTREIYKRYQTQKSKLVEKEWGHLEQTEEEIMESHGFVKIHDSGNIKFIWKKEN